MRIAGKSLITTATDMCATRQIFNKYAGFYLFIKNNS